MNLDPSSHAFEERDLTIKVGTNNLYGYKLFLTTPNDDTDLVNVADNTKTIPNLTSSTSVADFPVNNWGYRFTPNATSSTGNYGVFTSSDSTPIMSSDVPVNEQASTLGFAAKIDYTKPAGLYNLKLNFKAVPTVTTNYMQDIAADPTLAASICTEEPTVVIDKRDEQAYTIRRINGTCWMIENLAFTGTTMDSTTSNIAPEYTPANPYRVNGGNGYYDLQTDGASGGECYFNSGGNNNACIKEGEISITRTPIEDSITATTAQTVWYNYAAASAGTITGSNNIDPQLYDICPAGWKLPNNTEIANITSYVSNFNPVTGGNYSDGGVIAKTQYGSSWGSSVNRDTRRYRLHYNGVDTLSGGETLRGYGYYVRCVMKNTNINNLNYMQDFATLNESNNAAKKTQVLDSMELNSTTGYTLKDVRDNAEYTISKIGPVNDVSSQNVWMTKNLAIGCSGASRVDKSLSSDNSNVSTAWSTGSAYSLDKTDNTTGCTTGSTSDCNSYTVPRMKCDATYGAWYNYVAATAGTISGNPNSTIATEDVCPKGWKLPNFSLDGGGDGAPIEGASYTAIFNPTKGGFYHSGGIESASRGYYWGNEAAIDVGAGNANRYFLRYDSLAGELWVNYGNTASAGSRLSGMYIRCIAR